MSAVLALKKLWKLVVDEKPAIIRSSMYLPEVIAFISKSQSVCYRTGSSTKTSSSTKTGSSTQSEQGADPENRQVKEDGTSKDSPHIIVVKQGKPIGVLAISALLQVISTDTTWEKVRVSALELQPVCVVRQSEVDSIYSLLSLLRRNQSLFITITDNAGQIVGLTTKASIFRTLDSASLLSELKQGFEVSNQLETINVESDQLFQQASNYKQTTSERNVSVNSRPQPKHYRYAKVVRRSPSRITRESRSRDSRFISTQRFALQQKRAKLFADVALKIQQSLQLSDIISTAVHEVRRILQVDRVLIYRVNHDGTGTVISESVEHDYPQVLGIQFPEEVFPDEYQALYESGRIKAISNIHSPDLEIADCLVDFLVDWQVKAKLVVPIMENVKSNRRPYLECDSTNQLWGLMIAHQCRSPKLWSEFELEIMQDLANQIGLAIHQAKLLENLEDVVAERTTELSKTNISLKQEIQARIQTENALRDSEQQLRSITDALPALIAYVDRYKYYQFKNRTYEKWFGETLSNKHSRHMEEVLGESFYRSNLQYIESALSGEIVTYESEIETLRDEVRAVSVTYIPHVNDAGEVKGFFSLTSDISDRKAVEHMKDEFLTLVSHELRTPLTSIHGSLTLLASGRLGKLSEKGQRMLEIADESTERLVRLVNNILDLQRMESGKVTMKKVRCIASDLMVQAIDAMQAMAQQKQIILENHPLEIEISVDPDLMIQALTNLIANAIKFSKPNGTVFICATQVERDSPERYENESESSLPYLQIEVKDEGMGIPLNQLEDIFERFKQVDSSDSKKKGGSGLGLAICRKIIEQHEGHIWAESSMNSGSSFYFVLPIR